MPELPEVEIICNLLRTGGGNYPSLLGLTIRGTEVLWQRSLVKPGAEQFSALLTGQTIRDISRRGKFLVFHLDHHSLIIHLRMSGDLWVEKQEMPIAPHHRLIIHFHEGIRLAFNDPRKFGRCWFVEDTQEVFAGLGPEPFDPQLTHEEFYRRLQGKRKRIKALLLDQHFLAGLGNIYTDEALFCAKIHPLVLSNDLSYSQAKELLTAIRQVLTKAIQHNGTSIDWIYRGGEYQNQLFVYHRTGQPCVMCGSIIERIRLGQRSTHFCPQCQRIDRSST